MFLPVVAAVGSTQDSRRLRSKPIWIAITWLGLALAWAGYWAPWIAHRAAALNLNGYELAEWITFLPGVRDGSLRLGRLDFLIPLGATAIMTALAARFTPQLNNWMRWPARLLALIGAFAILPEYPFILTAHADPELRPVLILGLVSIAAVGATILWPCPPDPHPAPGAARHVHTRREWEQLGNAATPPLLTTALSSSGEGGRGVRPTASSSSGEGGRGVRPTASSSSGEGGRGVRSNLEVARSAHAQGERSRGARSHVDRFWGAASSLLAVVALGFSARALVMVWPALAVLFHAPPRLNWGPVVLAAAMALIIAGAIGQVSEQ